MQNQTESNSDRQIFVPSPLCETTANYNHMSDLARKTWDALVELTLCCQPDDGRKTKLETYRLVGIGAEKDGMVVCEIAETDKRGEWTGSYRMLTPDKFMAWIADQKKHVTAATLIK